MLGKNYLKHFLIVSFFIGLLCLKISPAQAQTDENHPNILLVIADDLGVDVFNGYHQAALMPTTPTLDSLRSVGITFDNVFSNPMCTPSRSTIMSGKYGIKNGVRSTPGNLDLEHTSIFKALAEETNNLYSDAVIGKWHISSPVDLDHPADHGADYFMGFMGSNPQDYFSWERTENGVSTLDTNYATSAFTDASIDWVNDQNQPWLLWLAHAAPHSPFHTPPSHMYSVPTTGNNRRKYIAMIESVDYELNRLLNAIPADVRENTMVIFIGDNGTPGSVNNDYPNGHAKGSLYQGGVRVPMVVAGAGVERQGVRESALVNINDIYATVLEVAGAELEGGIYNSLSFNHLLKNTPGETRDYNYSEISEMGVHGWTIRGPQYKLIDFGDGTQEFYDLIADSLEINNLMAGTLTGEQISIKEDFEIEAEQQRTEWSCRDHIKNGDEEGLDCGGSFCAPCVTTSAEENNKLSGISIYPNPVTTVLTIESQIHKIEEIEIYNILGQLVLSQKDIQQNKMNLNLNHLKAPIYTIMVKTKEGSKSFKIRTQ